MERIQEHGRELATRCVDALSAVPGVTVYGPRRPEPRGAVVAFTVAGPHPHDGAALLDAEGSAVRARHHCARPLMPSRGPASIPRTSSYVSTSSQAIDSLPTT